MAPSLAYVLPRLPTYSPWWDGGDIPPGADKAWAAHPGRAGQGCRRHPKGSALRGAGRVRKNGYLLRRFDHLAATAARAISRRRRLDNFLARARPPRLESFL